MHACMHVCARVHVCVHVRDCMRAHAFVYLCTAANAQIMLTRVTVTSAPYTHPLIHNPSKGCGYACPYVHTSEHIVLTRQRAFEHMVISEPALSKSGFIPEEVTSVQEHCIVKKIVDNFGEIYAQLETMRSMFAQVQSIFRVSRPIESVVSHVNTHGHKLKLHWEG